jgi:hypothetical protein
VLLTPVVPNGPPAAVGAMTAAGFPPPPAPPAHPEENAALKFFALPLESVKMPASPARIHEYGVTAAVPESIARSDVMMAPAARTALAGPLV